MIPTRNRREHLGRCLEALSRQSARDFDVIVVDDASTDDTPEAVRTFAQAHPTLRLRCLENKTHRGANAARNRGVAESHAELIAFLDSDCLPEPDWLQRLTRPFDDEHVAAATGLVDNPPPRNVFELAYRGSNRVHANPYPTRLVGGNLCVRRELLVKYPFDEDLTYGCDEEGLYRRLRAAGWDQRFVPDAKVRHDHGFTASTYFRYARRGGAATAWLVYKFHLPPRLDLLPLLLFYLSLALIPAAPWLAVIPAAFLLATFGAILYNELIRKHKTAGETILSFPVLIVYYHVRLAAFLVESVKLRLQRTGIKRERLGRG